MIDAVSEFFIDAHCHLASPKFDLNRPNVLHRAQSRGISQFLQGGIEPGDWKKQLQLQAEFPGQIHAVFGLHPWWVASNSRAACEQALTQLENALPKAVALGETGLDYSSKFPESTHPLQLEIFERQLELARRMRLPVVLHIVKAHEAAFKILRKPATAVTGILHSFSGSAELARRYTDCGLLISIGAAVLRETNRQLKKAVLSLTLEKLVIESDSPDQLGEPEEIFTVAQKIAELKNTTVEVVLSQSTQNLFQILRRIS